VIDYQAVSEVGIIVSNIFVLRVKKTLKKSLPLTFFEKNKCDWQTFLDFKE